jgi:hypothetical protein
MQRRSGSIFTASAASGLLLGLALSLCACPRPIDNPVNPDQPVAGEPDKGDKAEDVIEPGRPAPGDAGSPPPIDPRPDPDPPEVPQGREQPAVNPSPPPPMDPKNAPLRV